MGGDQKKDRQTKEKGSDPMVIDPSPFYFDHLLDPELLVELIASNQRIQLAFSYLSKKLV